MIGIIDFIESLRGRRFCKFASLEGSMVAGIKKGDVVPVGQKPDMDFLPVSDDLKPDTMGYLRELLEK